MSSALVRQALAFVDPEESTGRNKRKAGPRHRRAPGQEDTHPYIRKSRKPSKEPGKSKEQLAEENIKKLLALSKSTGDSSVTEKIVKRAVKGKPLTENVEVKTEEEKSILFPEESFGKFEKELFCS